jgi:hypothetical protein
MNSVIKQYKNLLHELHTYSLPNPTGGEIFRTHPDSLEYQGNESLSWGLSGQGVALTTNRIYPRG